ncbi:glutamate--cysteine ligase [Streptomyces sp. Je 1-79]|uniref:carboxylate-amine ligase n=1 Tax=Streptomyces sp. Je 1-79 TaxID=2943847 RepID=UPI0021A71704|nr:glutamate--cysteine ligase [Streptomyces sp. Je 1-79]MCT4353901.1 glutamate--cysteine ligase [Streptomyces sp. Je 1-79]
MQNLTLGVEEEFLLVDRLTRRPVSRAPMVIRDAAEAWGDQVQTELFESQIEIASRPTAACRELRDELARLRACMARAAHAHACLPVASGTPVLPSEGPLRVTGTERYQEMARRFPGLVTARGNPVCGCHVHIGPLDRPTALTLAAHIRPWLPVLQAVTANSPYAYRRDTGFNSWRFVEYEAWPTVGPPPVLDEGQYLRHVAGLVNRGTVLDRRMLYWYARPSEHVPTLEIRIADVNADLDTVILLAALTRALGATLLDEMAAGPGPPRVPLSRLLLAHELAAAHGISGIGLDPGDGRERPAVDLVHELIERAAPGLDAHGDTEMVEERWRRLRRRGIGATRQRDAFKRLGGLASVVDELAVLTAAS